MAFLIVGLGALLFSVLWVVMPGFQGQLPIMRARPEPEATARPAQAPRAPMAATDVQYYSSSEGRFLLKYPHDWLIEESPSGDRPLRIVLITPEARHEPERVTIFFGPGSGQSAEQVWISVLSFMQAMQDEDTEDWLLGEAISTSIGGYHARQIPFRYTHVKSQSEWQGLITGLVHDSMNYAMIAEAPISRWPRVWPLFEQIYISVQFQ